MDGPSVGLEQQLNLAAVCQMTSTEDKEDNFKQASHLIERAVKMGAKVSPLGF